MPSTGRGLRARGGFTADETWRDGRLVEAVIRADCNGKMRVRYGAVVREFDVKAGVATRYTASMFQSQSSVELTMTERTR